VNSSDTVWEGWGSVILVAGSTLVLIVVLGFIIWKLIDTYQAKTIARETMARDDAYRALAKAATEAQETFAADQKRMSADVADLRLRVVSIEALLREVG